MPSFELPTGVPPDFFSDRFIKDAESTMNATIREAVMVGEFIQSGSVESALDALTQIRLNAETVADRIIKSVHRAAKKGKL